MSSYEAFLTSLDHPRKQEILAVRHITGLAMDDPASLLEWLEQV